MIHTAQSQKSAKRLHHNTAQKQVLHTARLVMVVLHRRPHDLLAAVLRAPFVDFLNSMTRPELPLTVHEYGEWGDPSDPAVLKQASHATELKRNLHVLRTS